MQLSQELLALAAVVRGRVAGIVALGLLAVGASLLALILAGKAIGAMFAGQPLTAVWPLIAGAAVAAIARGTLLYAKEVMGAATAAGVKTALRTRIFSHLLALGPGYLEQRRTGEIVASAVDGVEALEIYYAKYLPQLFITALAPLGIFIYLWTLEPRIALVMAAFVVLALAIPGLFRRLTGRRGHWHWQAYARMASLVVDSLQGLPTLKAFTRGKARGREIADMATALYLATMRILAVNLWSIGLMDLTVMGGGAAALAVGALLAANGQLPVSTLLIVLLVGAEMFRPVRDLGHLYHEGLNGVSAATGIFRLLADRPDVVEPSAPPAALPAEHTIQLAAVTFGYDGGERPALRDFDLLVQAGETVALVGPSGSGKTTVVNLLLRLFDAQAGRITVGGLDVREWPLARLRALFATVSQDTYLFHGTVRDNLLVARPDADPATLEEAARAANAHDFILRLPDGYDTLIGERGMRLSGGERQRIAIARALLKDAPILLLDEATSSVDAENEEAIQEALRRLARGRTTLVIAHRLSTVADADRIVVVEAGTVVESGQHAALLAAHGAYARLVAAQQVGAPDASLVVGGAA